jgi:hypothetical protein
MHQSMAKIEETPARVVCQVLVALIAQQNVYPGLCEQDFRVICVLQSLYNVKTIGGRLTYQMEAPVSSSF